MKFTRFLRSIVALAAAIALSFTSGAAPAQADPSANPFAGSWSGPGTVDNEPVGTLDVTISDAGRLTGRVYHLQDDQSGALVGHVRADGYVMLVNFVPSDNPSSHNNGTPLQGTAVIDDDGTLVVSLTGRFSGGFSLLAILERN